MSVTASGSRRTYSCTSSFALRPFASSQDVVHVPVDAGKQFIDLVDSVRFIPGTRARQRLCIFRLAFRNIVPKNFRKSVRKVLRVQIVFEIFSAANPPALYLRALELNSISSGATARPPTPRALRPL